MPPKKKKTVPNPIVVGTVSTRSTRRQSIVKMEIPKLNRIAKNSPKAMKGSSKEDKEQLTKTIRNAYGKVIGSTADKSHSDDDKTVPKSNKALLEILQDWDDDDSQDDKRDISRLNILKNQRAPISDKDYENLEFDADDINEIIGNNYNKTSEPGPQELILNKRNEDLKCKEIDEVSESVETEMMMEIARSDNSNSTSFTKDHLEECLIQEGQEILVGDSVEVVYEDDIVMGCVIEENVPEGTEEVVISDLMEDSNTSILLEENQEKGESNSMTFSNANEVEGVDKDGVKESTISVECQSVSTNDSNDAEMRNFFPKDIEKDRIDEENISEHEVFIESETVSSCEDQVIVEESVADFIENETEVLENEKYEEKSCHDGEMSKDIQILSVPDQDSEDTVDEKGECEEICSESMETDHKIENESSLDEEVAKLNIGDELAVYEIGADTEMKTKDSCIYENKIQHSSDVSQEIFAAKEIPKDSCTSGNIIEQSLDPSEDKFPKKDILEDSCTYVKEIEDSSEPPEKIFPQREIPQDSCSYDNKMEQSLDPPEEIFPEKDTLEDSCTSGNKSEHSLDPSEEIFPEKETPEDSCTYVEEIEDCSEPPEKIFPQREIPQDSCSYDNEMEQSLDPPEEIFPEKDTLEDSCTSGNKSEHSLDPPEEIFPGKETSEDSSISGNKNEHSSSLEEIFSQKERPEDSCTLSNKMEHYLDPPEEIFPEKEIPEDSCSSGNKNEHSSDRPEEIFPEKETPEDSCTSVDKNEQSSDPPEEIVPEQKLMQLSLKPKTKRIKTPQPTEQFQKASKASKVTTSRDKLSKNTEAKSKDKKGKEVKTKKGTLNAAKKMKNKTDNSKIEKKDKKDEKIDQDSTKKMSKNEMDAEDTEVRRSSRIKSINHLNKKTTGRGLVKSKSETSLNECDILDNNSFQTESGRSTPTASPKIMLKDRKTRWTKSSENIADDHQSQAMSVSPLNKPEGQDEMSSMNVDEKHKIPLKDPIIEERLKQFVHLKENSYKTDRMTCKEAKKMSCDCFLTPEEIEAKEYGCGEDCLNRLLLIECGNLCQVGDRCTNKRFQKGQFAPVEVFNTEKKGLGLRAAANIPYGEFILEYVGEVVDSHEFDKRAENYSQDKNAHYYFMALRPDAIIDATMKGNISRFINHSCDPNAETQKWTANGELRIGFFSTRTILAGEEITFDYRFQRYGKEAQKCYCGASICRGWLGEEPDSEEEEDEDEEDESLNESLADATITEPISTKDIKPDTDFTEDVKLSDIGKVAGNAEVHIDQSQAITIPSPAPIRVKRKTQKKKPRIELFEEIDQLNEDIDMLVTTGLKNQAHTLKLSRLMVRAKEPQQRAKLLRILRRGELPCRRLFLDYHGLRLIHGYMIDAQQLVMTNKKYESLRLEMLQTLAVLPIPNKSMLQDSKVLSTVENWSSNKASTSPLDSDSNSPKIEQDNKDFAVKEETDTVPQKDDSVTERSIEDQEEEIKFLAIKLLEEWSNLKEVFRIPKKERIEQMKEHEREANKKFMQNAQNVYGNDQDKERRSDRYRTLSRYKNERENKKVQKFGDKPSAEFLRLSKVERRKLFALQHELREEERRLKQRELWRQHEMNCLLIGTDPRFTAPFDPSRGYQCIWNPQIGQWQNYPIPSNTSLYSQAPHLPNLNLPPHHIQKSLSSYSYSSPLNVPTSMGIGIPQVPLGGMTGTIQQQVPTSHSNNSVPLVQYQEHLKIKEEDPSQIKFMGPIPPPVKLPPKWKCAKDKYGRPYYYHIQIRKSQWEPPPVEEPAEEIDSESESSSDTSSVSSDTSSENSDSDDDIDDTNLLLEVRKQMDKTSKISVKSDLPEQIKIEDSVDVIPSPDNRLLGGNIETEERIVKSTSLTEDDMRRPSIDMRLKELDLFKDDHPSKKKRRVGLCEEIIISPRTDEDKKQFKEDIKRYKANKEKLRRQKELILQQTKKQLREIELKKMKEKRPKALLKVKIKDMPQFNSDAAKKIKETFRTNMASTVVHSLNAYRKADCTEGRITNTEDFKHLARKLTHFVMLKEMKHISKIEDLTCTDNVKMKAREYIRKYMSKFGEVYVKRNDSPDFKD